MRVSNRAIGAVVLGSVLALGCGPDVSRRIPAAQQDPGATGEVAETAQPGVPSASVPPAHGRPTLSPPPEPLVLEPLKPLRWELPPLQKTLPTYELQIPEASLQTFEADIWAPEVDATFAFDGKSLPAKVRLRGASARTFPKKSWNVDFEDLRFEGREELNLVAEYQDQTMMTEKLGYDLLEAMGVAAPKTRYVRVVINGEYQGVYLDIEEVDKKWVKARQMPDMDPDIYRCGSWDCEMKTWRGGWQGEWDKQTNETTGMQRLDDFLKVINFTPEPTFPEALAQTFEVDRFLRLMALEAVISNSYVEDSQSYYIHDDVTNRWYYVPWDLNNADPRWWPTYGLDAKPIVNHPLFPFTLQDPWLQKMYDRRKTQRPGYEPTFCNLRTRILLNPELRDALLSQTERAWEELLDPAVLHPRLEAMHALLAPHMKDDPYIDQQKFARGLQHLKDYVTGRRAFVRAELDRLGDPEPGLVIDAFDPASGWIELRNRGSAPVSTSGLVLTTYLRKALVPANVPARTIAPGEVARFTDAQLGVTFAAQGEVGLFDGESVAGMLDALYYGALPSGRHYVRTEQSGTWTTTSGN